MEIAITKRKPAVNWYMFALALAILINALVQLIFLIFLNPDSKHVIGLAISFIGVFLFGFHYIWEGKRIVYYKKYKTYMKVKELARIQSSHRELSSTFVTENGKLLR